MEEKLEELCSLYQKNINKNEYASDESKVIKYNDKEYDNNSIFITLIESDNKNLIFVNIEREKKLVFNGLLYMSEKDLSHKYSLVLCDLNLLSYEDFILKYHKLLKENFG